jgi:hypothetical protein
MISIALQRLVAAGVVDFNISHNAASAVADLFLRDDLKDLRLLLLKMILLFIDERNKINHPGWEI